MRMKTPCENPDNLSLDVILPPFVNKCQKGKRMHTRSYSSEESSESEFALLGEVEQTIVEAEAGVATWASGEAARGASGLKINVPAVSSRSSYGSTNNRSVEAER